MTERAPRVVAELGRPETPEETAARKAETSRRHREGQTFTNLVIALVVSLAVVLVTVLVVVRPDPPAPPAVDYRTIAAESGSAVPLVVPDLPATWRSNSAVYDGEPVDGVATWYIGFVTPGKQFIALRQGIDANPTWLANQLDTRAETGSATIDGIVWTVYDHRDAKDAGNYAYVMTAASAGSDIVLFGTASDAEFATIASAVSDATTGKG
ncbi:hypothetical protein BKA04_002003 [Cryobacterium mesophilum]|uniref:DUF4245 domain-containing protein n=1 Tax=Terrimesophilobacter mesophilus TaxID=433647 RepID=A0A4R8VBU8_9MICO|nr:DUF4245 family protein [Terrimesophilobacter mesophilus]MBB5633780.1 hypothetical protein [Terrimesophilobacter mesophilus]TFB80459.1 DUF4245 domain-containing protein [Terrimesophilobacter mesophilus]